MRFSTGHGDWVVKLVLVGVFGFFGVGMLNAPSLRPEAAGVVEVVGIDASSKYHLPEGVARVRLDNGDTVSAKVLVGVVALPGYRVQMRVYERVVTHAAEYEIFAAKNVRHSEL